MNNGPDACISLVTADDKDLLLCFKSKQREWQDCIHSQPHLETVIASQILEGVAEDMAKAHQFNQQDLEGRIPGVPKVDGAQTSRAYVALCLFLLEPDAILT